MPHLKRIVYNACNYLLKSIIIPPLNDSSVTSISTPLEEIILLTEKT